MTNPILDENTCWVKDTPKGKLVLRLGKDTDRKRFVKLFKVLEKDTPIFYQIAEEDLFDDSIETGVIFVVENKSRIIAFASLSKYVNDKYVTASGTGIYPNYRGREFMIFPALILVCLGHKDYSCLKADVISNYNETILKNCKKICKDLNLIIRIKKDKEGYSIKIKDKNQEQEVFHKKIEEKLNELGWEKKPLKELA